MNQLRIFFALRLLAFGFRPIYQKRQLDEIMSAIQNGRVDEVVRKVESIKPVPLTGLQSPVVLEGPILQSRGPKGLVSQAHSELDLKLKAEVEKLLFRRYPHLTRQYI